MIYVVLQSRRLALASCCHLRLGENALLVDVDVVVKIGQLVVPQSLLTRDEAAVQLAAKLRARALRGETLLLGMVVRFVEDGEGEYVGGEEDSEQGCYTFRFGMGATAKTERMHLALMEPEQRPETVEEGISPSR
eukprot:COSAG02_NODE_17020_length_1035_cov_0.776709_2_plen_135_part_00